MNEHDWVLDKYFINTFYNELITDRDLEIQDKLWKILAEVETYLIGDIERICYIGLYGSQNYKLDNQNSDIDCQCLIFPSIDDIVFHKNTTSTTISTKYGECVIKDIRLAINELCKSSPNILEVFGTNYSIVNRDYQTIITSICNNIDTYAHLNEYKYLKGLEGLWHKYCKETLEKQSNKSYANAFRIGEMINTIIDNTSWSYPQILTPKELKYLSWIKNEPDFDKTFKEDYFDNIGYNIEYRLNEYFESHEMTYTPWIYDEIKSYLKELIIRYLKLNI